MKRIRVMLKNKEAMKVMSGMAKMGAMTEKVDIAQDKTKALGEILDKTLVDAFVSTVKKE